MSSTDDAQVVVKPKSRMLWWLLAGLVTLGLAALLLALFLGRWSDQPASSQQFFGEILEIHDGGVLIEPAENDPIRRSGDRVWIGTANLPDIGAIVGNPVVVYFDGNVMESYPLQVHASDWALVTE